MRLQLVVVTTLLVLCLGMINALPPIYAPPPSALLPANITDLRVSAVTDTSVVLSWTEVASNNTAVARYLVRYAIAGAPMPANPPFLTTGGCGSPIYGSTTAGGRLRSCVLGGLASNVRYAFEVIAYTGTLTTTGNFSPTWSNRVEATTAQRIGPMLVLRPRMLLDTLAIAAASLPYDFGPSRYPVRGRFPAGDRIASFYDSTGALIAWGYLLIVRP